MAEYLNFEPNEFKIIEEFEFDETVQKPENIRFFTLDEQVNDAFDKFVPRMGRVSSYRLERIKEEVDKIQDLYEKFIVPEADDYSLRKPEYGRELNWIHPVYQSDERREYDFETEWNPIFTSDAAGFYPRMLAALPRPYMMAGETPYTFSKPTRFVAEDGKTPIIALPNYVTTRKKRHEDGKIEIIDMQVEGTADQVQFKGYYADQRSIDVPEPHPDHPFLKSKDAVYLETTAPLDEIIPSINSIVLHGVPAGTRDPYNVGMRYLKIYDVSLADIPWEAWKSRFPPVEGITVYPKPRELPYPKVDEFTPPPQLLKEYKIKYSSGLSQRNWLMNQIDAGNLVIKMLLSEAGKVGIVNQSAEILATGKPTLEQVKPEDCHLENLSFNEFILRGIYRDKNCVPLDFIREERKQIGYRNRIGWTDSTANDILVNYLKSLDAYRTLTYKEKYVPETKTAAVEESKVREEVVAILNDRKRYRDDKLKDILEIVRELPISKHNYNDLINGRFVLCEHTLELLGGVLDKDRKTFKDKWTVKENGFRVCKFCGERVMEDDFEEQEMYTEDGFKVVRASELETEEVVSTKELAAYTTDLKSLVSLFNLNDPAEDAFFLTMSILQITPEAGILKTVLDKLRSLTSGIKPTAKDAKKVLGAMGVGALCILIQIHIPILLPRRNFGTVKMVLSGFPRDDPKPKDFSIVDSLLLAIRKTFESSPTAFKGPAADFVRASFYEKADVRNKTITAINFLLSPKVDKDSALKNALVDAKAHRANVTAVEESVNSLIPTVVNPPANAPLITNYESCESGRPYWTTPNNPKYKQSDIKIIDRIPSTNAPLLEPSESERAVPAEITDSEIRKNLHIKLSKDIKLKIGDDWRTNIRLATHLASIFNVSFPELDTLDTTKGDGLLRDITKGFLHKILKQIEGNDKNLRIFQEHLDKTDVSLYIMTTDLNADKKNTMTLRAKERTTFTERMKLKSDIDREVTKELLKYGNIGKSAYVIVNRNREEFAQELEDSLMADRMKEELEEEKVEDTGVGEPRHLNEQGAVGMPENTDNGDYGDYEAEPINEGKDYQQEYMADENDPI